MGIFIWTRGGSHFPYQSGLSYYVLKLVLVHLVVILGSGNYCVMGTECMKRKYFEITVSYFGGINVNRTIKCDMYFQWTVADYCCYDKYDRFERNPFCCYSETYKLVLAVGFICLVLLASSFSIFFCWVYNLPHHLLFILSCGKFSLNNWMIRNKSGPYVDPSFYSGVEPFWTRGAEMQPYPLRPMPPKIFYPAPPPKMKYRWDMANGDIPLFIIASRQFTRNPYSARPADRHQSNTHNHLQNGYSSSSTTNFQSTTTTSDSRRNSLTSNNNNHLTGGVNSGSNSNTSSAHGGSGSSHPQRRESNSAPNGYLRRGSSALMRGGCNSSIPPPAPFNVNIDEAEAATELYEALKMLDERGEKSVAEWNAMMGDGMDGGGSEGGPAGNSRGIFLFTEGGGNRATVMMDNVRPNTTGAGGGPLLDHYGNYVSLTRQHNYSEGGVPIASSSSSRAGGTNRPIKPNTDALNQQISTLGMPVYSVPPGIHTAGLVSTVQNYHVVSSNLGNPMETILEDDSLDEDIIEKEEAARKYNKTKSQKKSTSTPLSVTNLSYTTKFKNERPPLKRRATIMTPNQGASPSSSSSSLPRVSSAIDHVVLPNPTTRAIVPFSPTLPGSMQEESSASTVDAAFVESVAARRNSII